MLKRAICLLLFAFGILGSTAYTSETDGRWWNRLSQGEKLTYVVGFFDGTGYSATLLTGATLKAMADPKTGEFSAARAEVAKATSQGAVQSIEENLSNLTTGQVVQGQDATYRDFRNQGISVLDCIYVVIYEIKGGSEADVTRLLEVRRKQAGR